MLPKNLGHSSKYIKFASPLAEVASGPFQSHLNTIFSAVQVTHKTVLLVFVIRMQRYHPTPGGDPYGAEGSPDQALARSPFLHRDGRSVCWSEEEPCLNTNISFSSTHHNCQGSFLSLSPPTMDPRAARWTILPWV